MDGFSAIGMCEALGRKKIALVAGGVGAFIGGLGGYLYVKNTGTSKKMLYILGSAFLFGVTMSTIAYISCR